MLEYDVLTLIKSYLNNTKFEDSITEVYCLQYLQVRNVFATALSILSSAFRLFASFILAGLILFFARKSRGQRKSYLRYQNSFLILEDTKYVPFSEFNFVLSICLFILPYIMLRVSVYALALKIRNKGACWRCLTQMYEARLLKGPCNTLKKSFRSFLCLEAQGKL